MAAWAGYRNRWCNGALEVLFQAVFQVGKELLQVALGFGFVAEWTNFLPFPGSEIPKVLLRVDALTALGRLGAMAFSLALVRHVLDFLLIFSGVSDYS